MVRWATFEFAPSLVSTIWGRWLPFCSFGEPLPYPYLAPSCFSLPSCRRWFAGTKPSSISFLLECMDTAQRILACHLWVWRCAVSIMHGHTDLQSCIHLPNSRKRTMLISTAKWMDDLPCPSMTAERRRVASYIPVLVSKVRSWEIKFQQVT